MTEALFEVISPILSKELGYCHITSANDGTHSVSGSLHFVGCALDFRTWTTRTSQKQIGPKLRAKIGALLSRTLGPDFDVVTKSNHFHIEYQPKSPTR